jgi:hypothetical protein
MKGRVLLMRLSIRKSASGTEYLSGFLGAARVVAFKAKEPDCYGNDQWEVFVAEPEPKADQLQQTRTAARGQRTWDRSRDADRAQQAQRPFHDDSAEAITDLERGPGQ